MNTLTASYAIAIVVASSLDCFVAGLSYGCNRIKLRLASSITIVTICASTLGITLLLGSFLSNFLDANTAKLLGSGLLATMGLSKIATQTIKTIVNKKQGINSKISFRLFSLKFIINISGSPEKADIDGNKTISLCEAILLGLALSLDNLSIGLGTGLGIATIQLAIFAICLKLIMAFFCLNGGMLAGKLLSKKPTQALGWLSGLLLVTIGIVNWLV